MDGYSPQSLSLHGQPLQLPWKASLFQKIPEEVRPLVSTYLKATEFSFPHQLEHVHAQLLKLPVTQEEASLVSTIEELKAQFINDFKAQQEIKTRVQKSSRMSNLVIQHRASFESKAEKKQPPEPVTKPQVSAYAAQLQRERDLLHHYSHFFFMLRVSPFGHSYLGPLAWLIPEAERENYLNLFFRLFPDETCPTEEYLLVKTLDDTFDSRFFEGDPYSYLSQKSPPLQPETITSQLFRVYHSRKRGQKYLNTHFKKLILGLANSVFKEKDSSKAIQRYSESIFQKMVETVDDLPYGTRYLCKERIARGRKSYPEHLRQDHLGWSFIGYHLISGFIGQALLKPDIFGIRSSDDVLQRSDAKKRLKAVEKVLMSIFTLKTPKRESQINQWIISKHHQVCDYLAKVIDLQEEPQQAYHVNRYGLYLTEKTQLSLNISVADIYQVHQLISTHSPRLDKNQTEVLSSILERLGRGVRSWASDDPSMIQLNLENGFTLRYLSDHKKENPKQNAIDNFLGALKTHPTVRGPDLLQTLTAMGGSSTSPPTSSWISSKASSSQPKPSKKNKKEETEESKSISQVDQVIKDVNSLAYWGLIDFKDPTGFLQDVLYELREKPLRNPQRQAELVDLKEVLWILKQSVSQLLAQEKNDTSALNTLKSKHPPDTKIRKLQLKDLLKSKVLLRTEETKSQGTIISVEISQSSYEQFFFVARLSGNQSNKSCSLDLVDLLDLLERGINIYSAEGLDFSIPETISFLNKKYYKK